MSKIKVYMGIDPGKIGAMALIGENMEYAGIFDWPGDCSLIAKEFCEITKKYHVVLAILEKVHSMPKQGVCSSFNFGKNLGNWEGVLASFGIPYREITPQKWQKLTLDKSLGKDTKEAALNTARRLFPSVDLSKKKYNGRADALLMAYYGKLIT